MDFFERKTNMGLSDVLEGGGEFIPMLGSSENAKLKEDTIPEELGILPLRNTVLFPGVLLPITVGREKSVKLIKEVDAGNKFLGVFAQKDGKIEDPTTDDVYKVGVMAHIIKVLKMPDDSTTVIIQGKNRIQIDEWTQTEPFFKAKVKELNTIEVTKTTEDISALVDTVKDMSLKIIELNQNIPTEAGFAVKNIDNPSFLINFISSNLSSDLNQKQALLEIDNFLDRANKVVELLNKDIQLQELKNQIQNKTKSDIDKQQRDYFLNQQMRAIQDELGGSPHEQEINDLKKKAKNKKWSKIVSEKFEKELEKLSRMNPQAAEFSVQHNYLETLVELPWNEFSNDDFDLKKAQKILDEDHYGLEDVKDRIIEYLAVLKLKGDMKSPILCLVGPPGVGKTSLGKSVARSLSREYNRMALGGLRDESEIRGHRKTYIGAMPGRIIQSLKKSKKSNPVFVLDEIDKVIGSNVNGDPASALLEVLDPEQNSSFYDNYLELEYDLSKILFIATANSLRTIHPALIDRMEIINISGYMVEEKYNIAKKHLIPRQFKEHGLSKKDLSINKEVITKLIENYTMESGVRNLEKNIAKLIRNTAKHIVLEEDYNKKLKPDDLVKIMGPEQVKKDNLINNEIPGVVTGLAWTAVGGKILIIESNLSKGKGTISLTGNLGDVMKESATVAFKYLKANAEDLDIPIEIFEKYDVHIHVPEGAVPKDGPSAGITIFTALASLYTQRKIKSKLAMTGELTLRSDVLPVGGIKEKMLAAKRSGITEIIVSEDNRKDVEDIDEKYRDGLKFHYVKSLMEVIDIALLKTKVSNAKKFDLK